MGASRLRPATAIGIALGFLFCTAASAGKPGVPSGIVLSPGNLGTSWRVVADFTGPGVPQSLNGTPAPPAGSTLVVAVRRGDLIGRKRMLMKASIDNLVVSGAVIAPSPALAGASYAQWVRVVESQNEPEATCTRLPAPKLGRHVFFCGSTKCCYHVYAAFWTYRNIAVYFRSGTKPGVLSRRQIVALLERQQRAVRTLA